MRTRLVKDCLVELTSEERRAAVYINSSYVTAIGRHGTGTMVYVGQVMFHVTEDVETVRKRMAYG